MIKNRFFNSKIIAILISLLIIILHFYNRTYHFVNWDKALSWDIFAYYVYLPSIFIYHDPGMIDQSWVNELFTNYSISPTHYQIHQLDNGNWSSMYSMGFALLYLPFFFLGHIWALWSNYAADGMSLPYQIAIANGILVYIIAGVFIIRKLLLKFFTDSTTSIVILLLFFGTNYFHQSVNDNLGPHATMFAAIALSMYLGIKWHEKPSIKNSILFGFIAGFMVLLRANSIIALLVPVFWGVYNKTTFIDKCHFLKRNIKSVVFVLIAFLIIPSIQFIFWKITTGHFFFNPYGVTPGFDWIGPQFGKVFFSLFKGWLIYTPLMIFALFGLYFTWKKNKIAASGIIIATTINIYVLSCWGTWYGGGGFGGRYFVEFYAVLAIPLGYFIEFLSHKKILKYISIPIILFFVFLNQFQTWQFNHWIFDGYNMTNKYYKRIFLKTKISEEDLKYKGINRVFESEEFFSNPQDYSKKVIGILDFDNNNSIKFDTSLIEKEIGTNMTHAFKLCPKNIYSPTFSYKYKDVIKKDHAWFRINFDFYPLANLSTEAVYFVSVLDHNKEQYLEKYKSWNIGLQTDSINQLD